MLHAYEERLKDRHGVTPTYVPAVTNNAYVYFRNSQHLSEHEAIRWASLFTLQVLEGLWNFPRDRRVSCRIFATPENLQKLLEPWYGAIIKENNTLPLLEFALSQEGEFSAGLASAVAEHDLGRYGP